MHIAIHYTVLRLNTKKVQFSFGMNGIYIVLQNFSRKHYIYINLGAFERKSPRGFSKANSAFAKGLFRLG